MDDPYIGLIQPFPFNYAPQNYTLCNGALLQIASNQALYALLGINYGGDGRTTFGLPNMIGMEPTPGVSYYIATMGYFPSRA